METLRAQMLVAILVLVLVSVGFMFGSLPWRRSNPQRHLFSTAPISLRIGMGTLSILGYWVTGNTLTAAPESTGKWGVLGSIGYSLIGGLALMVFAPIATRVRRMVPNGRTIGDFYANRFGVGGYTILFAFQVIYGVIVLVTQGAIAGFELHNVANIPYKLGTALSLAVSVAYVTVGGFTSIVRINVVQVFTMLTVVAAIPTFIFVKVGSDAIYQGMTHYAPDFLRHPISQGGLVFILSGVLMGIGEVLLDNTFWQRMFSIRCESVAPSFLLSGAIWMLVPLSISTVSFVGIAYGMNPNDSRLAADVVYRFGGWTMSLIFLVGVWAAVTSTIGAFLSSFSSVLINDARRLFRQPTGRHVVAKSRVLIILMAAVSYAVCTEQHLSMLGWLLFAGVMNASIISPMIFGVFGNKLTAVGASVAVLTGVMLGYVAYFQFGDSVGIATSFVASFLVSLIGLTRVFRRRTTATSTSVE